VNQSDLECAAALLAQSHHALALTGAGHSTPSGIPDFRSPGAGLWEQVDPMIVASAEGFRDNVEGFYDWLRPLAQKMVEAEPNAAHLALAELEELGVIHAVITQNIDRLHQRAGSQRVLELHGSVSQATCTGCGRKVAGEEMWPRVIAEGGVARCGACGAVLKPDVVLFGEPLPLDVLLDTQQECMQCDVMLIAGSSLEVYPAGGLPRYALSHGAQLIIVNYQPTSMDRAASVVIHDDVATALPALVERIRSMRGCQEHATA